MSSGRIEVPSATAPVATAQPIAANAQTSAAPSVSLPLRTTKSVVVPSAAAEQAAVGVRDAGFSATIAGGLAALFHPFLPSAIREAFPPPVFTMIVSGAGVISHRLLNRVWIALLGPIAKEAASALKTYTVLRKIQMYRQLYAISGMDAQKLARQVVLNDLEQTK